MLGEFLADLYLWPLRRLRFSQIDSSLGAMAAYKAHCEKYKKKKWRRNGRYEFVFGKGSAEHCKQHRLLYNTLHFGDMMGVLYYAREKSK